MLTEAERNIVLRSTSADGTTEEELAARSLVASKRDVRGSATFNGKSSAMCRRRSIRNWSMSRAFAHRPQPTFWAARARHQQQHGSHWFVLNGTTKTQWRWTVTGNGDRRTSHRPRQYPVSSDRVRQTRRQAISPRPQRQFVQAAGGNASTTLTLGGSAFISTMIVMCSRAHLEHLVTHAGAAAVNLDLPISQEPRFQRARQSDD
jgi:hypothetical protein